MNKYRECYKIYCEAFGEEDSKFTDYLFENCFDNCILYEIEKAPTNYYFLTGYKQTGCYI